MGNYIGIGFGVALLVFLAFQFGLFLVSGIKRTRHEASQRALAREQLELQIRIAKAQLAEIEGARFTWTGYRKLVVYRKQQVCDGVFAFYMRAHDGRPLSPFQPGQFLTFRLNILGCAKPIVRCYSLSSSPADTSNYRVTIKFEPPPPKKPDAPPGLASGFFCNKVREGYILDAKAPAGKFFLDQDKMTPVVLLAGGVGITPMLSMAHAIKERDTGREVWFIVGVRSGQELIHSDELAALAEQPNMQVRICFSKPGESDEQGRDYHHEGRVTPDLMKEILPSKNFEFYLCGNGSFMNSLHEALEIWGVPEEKIHFEAFGPATVKRKAETNFVKKQTQMLTKQEAEKQAPKVTLNRSSTTHDWGGPTTSLLEFIQEKGGKVESGCCAGSCGSCVVAIKSGEIEYIQDPDSPPEEGTCLTCISIPKTDVVLDA
jgi:ferredoxin-NADP reductase